MKRYISLAGDALLLTVVARVAGDDRPSAFLVRRQQAGVLCHPLPNFGDHPVYRIELDDARAEALVGGRGHGLRLACGTLAVFARASGPGRGDRPRGGRANATSSAVRSGSSARRAHCSWRSYLAPAAARSVVLEAARRLDRGERADHLSSAAEILGTEAGFTAVDAAVAVGVEPKEPVTLTWVLPKRGQLPARHGDLHACQRQMEHLPDACAGIDGQHGDRDDPA